MSIGLDEPFSYDIAYEELKPGVWLADVDIPALHLQLMDIYLVAFSGDEVEHQAVQLARRVIWEIRNPRGGMLN